MSHATDTLPAKKENLGQAQLHFPTETVKKKKKEMKEKHEKNMKSLLVAFIFLVCCSAGDRILPADKRIRFIGRSDPNYVC